MKYPIGIAAAIAAFLAVYVALDARAQQAAPGGNCAPRADMLASLSEHFGEAPRVIALTQQGNVMEITVSASGSWSLLVTTPNGNTCMAAAGTDFGKSVLPPEGDPA